METESFVIDQDGMLNFSVLTQENSEVVSLFSNILQQTKRIVDKKVDLSTIASGISKLAERQDKLEKCILQIKTAVQNNEQNGEVKIIFKKICLPLTYLLTNPL